MELGLVVTRVWGQHGDCGVGSSFLPYHNMEATPPFVINDVCCGQHTMIESRKPITLIGPENEENIIIDGIN